MDFVSISGATNPASGYGIVDHSFRMGKFEVTNDQWNKFETNLGMPVTGYDKAYRNSSQHSGADMPTDNVSWYEAAQFVNWLNTSTGHHAAYNFTGEQGTNNYTFATWSAGEAAGGTNLYRHKNAFYYLPTENEWVKAAYWNGTSLRTYASDDNDAPWQGSGTSNTGWNYWDNGSYATVSESPWNVGSGSRELNGTYDMMGNVWEWMESPYDSGDYSAGSARGTRGGDWYGNAGNLPSSHRTYNDPTSEFSAFYGLGFRVASAAVPEPSSLAMFLGIALTAFLYGWRKRA